MTTYIALLRAVNVGGHKPVAMSDLTRMLAGLGLSDARSLLQSGNLVFGRDSRGDADLVERLLEKEARNRLGLETDFFVRSATQWSAVVANNPFRGDAERDPSHLLVMFTKTAANPRDVDALQASIAGPEVLRSHNRHLYIVYPAGIGRSRLKFPVRTQTRYPRDGPQLEHRPETRRDGG